MRYLVRYRARSEPDAWRTVPTRFLRLDRARECAERTAAAPGTLETILCAQPDPAPILTIPAPPTTTPVVDVPLPEDVREAVRKAAAS